MAEPQLNNPNNSFDSLTKELTNSEKKKLLEKLSIRLDTTAEIIKEEKESITSIYSKKQDAFIEHRIHSMSLLDKIILWFRSIFTGKTRYTLVLDDELSLIKKKINTQQSGLIIDFDTNQITFKVISLFLPLFTRLLENETRFKAFFLDQEYYYGFLSYSIENRFAIQLKEELELLHPENILEEQDNEKYLDQIIFDKEMNLRLSRYFNKFEKCDFSILSKEMTSFDTFLLLLKFDIRNLLSSFKINNVNEQLSIANNIEFFKVSKSLEILGTIINNLDDKVNYADYLKGLVLYTSVNPVIHYNDQVEIFHEQDIQGITDIFNIIFSIKKTIPFQEIFKYFNKNLFYCFKQFSINYDLIQIYKESKKAITESSWKRFYINFKKKLFMNLVNEILPDFDLNSLAYFNNSLRDIFDKDMQRLFININSLNIINKFNNDLYLIRIEKLMNRLLIDGTFVDNLERESLSTAYQNLKEAKNAIQKFDNSLSNTGETGKKLRQLRQRSTGDEYFRTNLKNAILDLNKESKDIINAIMESYEILIRFLRQFSKPIPGKGFPVTNLDNVKPVSGTHIYIEIEKTLNYFEKLYKILSLSETIQ